MSGMPIVQREFEELVAELDPGQTGHVNYDQFMQAVFLTRMYLKELNLTMVLQQLDTQNKGGITIRQM